MFIKCFNPKNYRFELIAWLNQTIDEKCHPCIETNEEKFDLQKNHKHPITLIQNNSTSRPMLRNTIR